MIKEVIITKVISAPYFKFHKWWIDVQVKTEENELIETFVTGDTKFEVIKGSNIGLTISCAY